MKLSGRRRAVEVASGGRFVHTTVYIRRVHDMYVRLPSIQLVATTGCCVGRSKEKKVEENKRDLYFTASV